MSELYQGQFLDRILSDKKLPSHDWCEQHHNRFDVIMRIAEAEHVLIEAVNLRDTRQRARSSGLPDPVEQRIEGAREALAAVYLETGVASDVDQAHTQARQAQVTIMNNLHHESVTKSRR